MAKVSVIVPVYNVQKYLPQCMDSIIGQSLNDMEIICIDDGSTDSSSGILDHYAMEDSRVKVVHRKNSGYGAAINYGMAIAAGEYIGIVESDDYICHGMYENLYQLAIENNADIVKADYYEFQTDNSKEYRRYYKLTKNENYGHLLPAFKELAEFRYTHTWSGLYNAEYLRDHSIVHNESAGASYQDVGFWFQTLLYTERAFYVPEPYYMYRQDNAMSSSNSKEKLMAYQHEFDFIREKLMNYQKDDRQKLLEFCAGCELENNVRRLLNVSPQRRMDLCRIIKTEVKALTDRRELNADVISARLIKELFLIITAPELECSKVEKILQERALNDARIKQYKTVILYGAGKYALRMADYLSMEHMWNREIICAVSEKNNEGYDRTLPEKIVEIRNISDDLRDAAMLIICTKNGSRNYLEMSETAIKLGFRNIYKAEDFIDTD